MQNYKILLSTCSLSLITIIFVYLIYSDSLYSFNRQQTPTRNPFLNMLDEIKTSSSKQLVDIKSNLFSNPNQIVFRYVNLPLDYRYGSNAIPLTVATLLTKGDILELGMGLFSTPLLHNIGTDLNRQVVSVDTDYAWLSKFLIYNLTDNHKIYCLNNDQMNQYGLKREWGLVLVDHINGPNRYLNVINFSKLAQIVVVHDAEKSQENFYGYEKNRIRESFKYVCKYSIYQDNSKLSYISTLLLSNYIQLNDLSNLFKRIKTDFGQISCDVNYK